MKQKLLILLLLLSVVGNICFLYQINTMRSSLNDINSQTEELTSVIAEKDKTIESLNTSVEALQTKIADLQSKYDTLLISNEELKKSNESLEIEKTSLQEEIKKIEEEAEAPKPTVQETPDEVVDAYIEAERQRVLDIIAATGGANTGTNSVATNESAAGVGAGVTLE